MDSDVWAHQCWSISMDLNQLWADTTCSLEDVSWAMDDSDVWQEREREGGREGERENSMLSVRFGDDEDVTVHLTIFPYSTQNSLFFLQESFKFFLEKVFYLLYIDMFILAVLFVFYYDVSWPTSMFTKHCETQKIRKLV